MGKNKNLNRYSPGRLGDHIIMCDQCGAPCWYSEATKLTTETGKGGLLVCPDDVDPIDYGLVPYKIRPSKAPVETRTNNLLNEDFDTLYNPVDLSNWTWDAPPASFIYINEEDQETIDLSDNYQIGI